MKFVKAETDLFRVRYYEDRPDERAAFLASKRFGGESISDDEKMQYKQQLMATTYSIRTEDDFIKEIFYRVRSSRLSPGDVNQDKLCRYIGPKSQILSRRGACSSNEAMPMSLLHFSLRSFSKSSNHASQTLSN